MQRTDLSMQNFLFLLRSSKHYVLLYVSICNYDVVDTKLLMKLHHLCVMAAENEISATPVNGCLPGGVDCDELIATVYGTHICALISL